VCRSFSRDSGGDQFFFLGEEYGTVVQCVAELLQSAAVCRSVMEQCVSVLQSCCYSLIQCAAMHCSVLE